MYLYELTSNYMQVLDMIEDGNEDFLDTLESIEESLEYKVENYGKVIKSLEANVEGLKTEEKRLAERRKFMESSIKRMKSNVEQSMIATNKLKIKGDLFTFSIQKNPPRLEVLDDSQIPEGFFIPQPPILNNKELLEELKLGHEIPGATIAQGQSLRIR